jgi:hypothetical protein
LFLRGAEERRFLGRFLLRVILACVYHKGFGDPRVSIFNYRNWLIISSAWLSFALKLLLFVLKKGR